MGESKLHGAALLPDDIPRIAEIKRDPREPVWSVVHRLLDFWDAAHPKNLPQPAPEVPA